MDRVDRTAEPSELVSYLDAVEARGRGFIARPFDGSVPDGLYLHADHGVFTGA
jgi:hypothetical protein